ncbi:Ig-like domain-containing domain [Hymenobacter sp. BT730]|uniref:Ig-like domain-containing domain n=1 Tax=Hymenobacter sp. BT730 TaxID=3063332 RepID=UPI0026E11119|nr:Ig-like domain-containing domain [Hymenobacter sp. BT730]
MPARAYLPLFFLVGTVLSGCAAISSPEGGARDTVPPKLVSTQPTDRAVNVTGRTIRLEFSEPVQVKDLTKNLLVAPLLSEANKYKVREERNAIELQFEKPFEPNTTYSFNFREAISDITESNPATDVILSFSTGAALDSGSVKGSVRDLLTQAPAADVSVVLYPEADTANIRRGRPYYLARTDKEGQFTLRNLKEGRFRLFALADKNQTSRYEEGEKIAYLPEMLTVRPGIDSVQLLLTRPDSRPPIILSQKAETGRFAVSYNEGVRTAALSALAGNAVAPELLQVAEAGKRVNLYQTAALQAGRYLLAATDSAGNTARDTVNVKFAPAPPTASAGLPWTIEGNAKEVYRQGQIVIKFSEPLRLEPKKPVGVLVEDSTTRRPLQPANIVLSPDRTQLTVALNTRARNYVTLLLDSTVVQSVTGQSLRLRPMRFVLTEQSTTGTVAGTVQTAPKRRFELQLLDEKGNLVRSLLSPKTFRFDNLAPGSYRIRVLVDANGDGRWQAGDPQLRQVPEPVFIYPQPIQVRANWEVEDIRVSF